MQPDEARQIEVRHRPPARSRWVLFVLALGICLLPAGGQAIKSNNNNKPPFNQPPPPPKPPLKSGYIPPGCGKDPVKSPMLLDCWLTSFPFGTPGYNIKNQIRWEVAYYHQMLFWTQWEDWRKGDLRRAFLAAWKWHESGFASYSGTPLPDPLPNQQVLADADGPVTLLDENTQVWPIYVATGGPESRGRNRRLGAVVAAPVRQRSRLPVAAGSVG